MRNQDSLRVFAGIPTRWSGKMPFAGVEWKKTLRDLTFVSHKDREKPTDGDFKHKARPGFLFLFVFWVCFVFHKREKTSTKTGSLQTEAEYQARKAENILTKHCPACIFFHSIGPVCDPSSSVPPWARACASACTWHICYATDKKKKGQYGAKGSSPPPITELLSIPAQTLLHLQLHLGERCHRSKHTLISSLSADESVTQQYSVSVSARTVLCWCSQKARAPAGAASALWMMNMISHQLDLTCSQLIVRFTQPLSSILIIVLLIKGPPSKIPCKWSWQLWPWAFVSFTSSLLLLFSSWVHYHYYYPPTFFPFIWLPYFLSSSQPFSQNPPPPLLNSPILCSMFSVLPVLLVSHQIGNWQQIVPQTRVRWLQGVSPSLFC